MHVTAQKQKFYKHKQKGKSARTCHIWLSIIIDGMDQAKTCAPRLHRNPKNLDGHEVLNVHLTGVIIHGHMHQLYTWVDNFPKDSNVTATVLLEALKDLKKLKGPSYKHPRNLFLQLDNCSGENKNRFFLTFLAMLVQLGVFDRIKLSFLQVGHTHEDIDQLFSRLSTLWVSCDIFSVDQLMEIAQTVNYQSGTMKEMTAKFRRAEKDDKDEIDQKNEEDGDEETGGDARPTEQQTTKYKLRHRHLTEIADVNTWSDRLWQAKSWTGHSKFRCFDFRREAVKDPDGGADTIRCRVRVRKCMCSEGDPACDVSLKNYWQPRVVGQPDGVIMFGDDEKMPDVHNIPKVLRKPLPTDRKTICSFFSKQPAFYLKKKHQARHSNDDEQDEEKSTLGEFKDRIHPNPAVAKGIKWFSSFFDEQEGHTETMCDECRAMKTEEAELKSKESSMVAERLLRKSLREQRLKDAAARIARRREGKNPSNEDKKDQEQEKPDAEEQPALQLKELRKDMRALKKKLKEHVRETEGDEMHAYYHTGSVFGRDKNDISEEEDEDEDMGADDTDDDEDEEDYIVLDEYQSEFRIEKIAEVRKVHKTGCVVGQLVVFRSEDEDPFYVGKLLRRCPFDPERMVEIQYYGNDANTFDKAYRPGWLDKKGNPYYSEDPTVRMKKRIHTADPPFTQSIFIETIITWSCDWELTEKCQLNALARKRIEQTPGVAYTAPVRKKKK